MRKLSLSLYIIAACSCLLSAQDNTVRIHTIHTGYGDCTVIEARLTDRTHNIMIDAGTEKYKKKIRKYLKRHDLLPLDAVILTHPHDNHFGALPYLLDRTAIDRIYMNGADNTEKEFRKLKEILEKTGIPQQILSRGDRIDLGKDCVIECLHPDSLSTDMSENDASLVLLFTFGKTSFLFTGDIGLPVQKMLAAEHRERFSFLHMVKLPHHGDLLDESFASAVRDVPFPVMPVGKNKYGLPAVETLKLFGSRLLRTDRCIDIILESNGSSVQRLKPKK